MGGTRPQLRLHCELLSGLRAVHPGVLQGSVLPAACHGLSSSSPKASLQELSVLVGCHRWPLPMNLLGCLIRGVPSRTPAAESLALEGMCCLFHH